LRLEEFVKMREHENKRAKAIEILNRLPKYVQGYLRDLSIDIRKDYSGDPLEVLIRVYLEQPTEKIVRIDEEPVKTVEVRGAPSKGPKQPP